MNKTRQHKLDLGQWLDQLHGAIEQLEHCHAFDPAQTSRWRQHWEHAHTSLQEPLLRVAVVGAVKSGKSTLINALAGRDLLKRGAGITTAFITRLITNERPGGWIEFKPWPQVSREINQLRRLLAVGYESDGDETPLDIRNPQDFQRLTAIRDALIERLATSPFAMDANFILLDAYLRGYPSVGEQLADAVTRITLAGSQLHEHQRYVGQEAQAIYLRDVELHLPVSWLGEQLEIADCQGSDSPNPLHFEALQSYLLRSHFIVYLISGRTGLREADFRLLNLIKSLRMLPHTLFVLNIDLDLHTHVDDLNVLSHRVQTELGWFVPKPHFFAFSAWYDLVSQLGTEASIQEQQRLQPWSAPGALGELMETSAAAFRSALSDQVDRHRRQVFLASATDRVAMLAASIADSAATLQAFLAEDQDAITQATKKLKERQHVFTTVCNTLQQALQKVHDELRTELETHIEEAFDLTSGPLVLETLALIEPFAIDGKQLGPLSSTTQVIQRLHAFYLQFRQDLWEALVEKTNVKIIAFARDREAWLQERLDQAAKTFWSLFLTAMEDYRQDLARLHLPCQATTLPSDPPWPLLNRMSPPQFSTLVQRAPLTRPVLLAKFGLGRLSQCLEDLKARLGRPTLAEPASRQASLAEALTLVKSETRTELLLAFRDYQRAFKNDYLFRILKEACRDLLLKFQAYAELAQVNFVDALEHGEHHQERRRALMSTLVDAQHRADAVRHGVMGYLR